MDYSQFLLLKEELSLILVIVILFVRRPLHESGCTQE